MAQDDEYKHKLNHTHLEDTDDSDEGGESGGQAGKIEFREFVTTGPLRDDLPGDKLRHIIIMHEGAHLGAVKKQKEHIDILKQAKENKDNVNNKQRGQGNTLGGGTGHSEYKDHPILSKKANGADNKVSPLPNENTADTNDELKNRLVNRLQNVPKFNPKPLPR